ncbi:organic hydroperoxide resistance protein [Lentzea sp. HUAS12]|uniref:organic hydroperoxide resistance protein n=1 Tax=Lentzea sp. HUAS12 TaxID=2951806 RepID=UPI00209FFBA9|nr:organic hydroperoxide resistance protein [Lentzea sp. HUAS12]USX49827.1 organic hydroperoxide resistance protein [Lentzea sp. HUAS12]
MEALYTAEATAYGEGRNGEVRSSDGVIDEILSVPREMGGPGGEATNPEQLFAAGYSACFNSAIAAVARAGKIQVASSEVTAKVGIGSNGAGGFQLAVELAVKIPGLDQAVAEKLVEQAHQVCPYSNATRGNIEVALTVTV